VTNSQAEAAGTVPLWTSQPALINMPFAIINTSVLVASSFTCQMGVFAAERGQVTRTGGLLNLRRWGLREWYTLTFLMGAFFIGGQAYEYAALFHEGLTISSNAYGSVFFLATGFHGLHVTGGLVAFLLLLGRTFLARTFTHEQAVSAVVVSYYWHFVDVVWIALFGVIYILQ
jgi:cytochrome c oxidase subunit III